MNWLDKIASPEQWLTNQGIPTEFINFALNDNQFPRKMQKWVAIQLNKKLKEIHTYSPRQTPKDIIEMFNYGLIEIRDWFNHKSRTERGFNINQYSIETADQASLLWQEEMADERGEGHARYYKYPRGITGTEYEEVGDGFIMVEVPAEDLPNEGAIMQHCVGDNTQDYTSKIEHGDSKIFSLRDQKGWPHTTIEVENRNEFDIEEFDNDPENWVRDEAGNLVDIDYDAYGDRSASWAISQIQGKQNDTPVDKYKPYIYFWLKNHPEFNPSEGDFLEVTSDAELLNMIHRDKKDLRPLLKVLPHLSDEAKIGLVNEIAQDKGLGWSLEAIEFLLDKIDSVYDFGDPRMASLLQHFIGDQQFGDHIREKATRRLMSGLLGKVNRDPDVRQYVKDLALNDTSPGVANEALNTLKQIIHNPLDEGKSGPIKTKFPDDVVPIAMTLSDRFKDNFIARQLHIDILGSAIRSTSDYTAAILVERAMGKQRKGQRGPSTYEIRSHLGNIDTKRFYEIWKQLQPQTRSKLYGEDKKRELPGTGTRMFDAMKAHSPVLQAWENYQLKVNVIKRQEHEDEEHKKQGRRPYPRDPVIEPTMPEWNEEWQSQRHIATTSWLQKTNSEFAPTYMGVGHNYIWNKDTGQYDQLWRHEDDIITLWYYENGKIKEQKGLTRHQPTSNWDAFGRIETGSGNGSIAFYNYDPKRQKRILEALIDKYPGIKFTIYGMRGGSYTVQQYWNTLESHSNLNWLQKTITSRSIVYN